MDQLSEALLSDTELQEIETLAIELANLAGAEIVTKLGSEIAVRYKNSPKGEVSFKDPVSDVDERVESLIRTRLAEHFPAHDVIGEEMTTRGLAHDVLWAVDPIDGTANFVNGFPLFAASIGVLHRGRPVVGAIWCSLTHRLRPGVYHARVGSGLFLDGETATPRDRPSVRRGLAGLPDYAMSDWPWQIRKTGSAAIECAFVAAGLLQVARFDTPNIWDVAGGAALMKASGGDIRTRTAEGWSETRLETALGNRASQRRDSASVPVTNRGNAAPPQNRCNQGGVHTLPLGN